MKKAVCLFICLCLLSLNGCQTIGSPDPVKTLCNADVITVSTGEFLFSMEMRETGCVFRFASPELLSNLVLDFDGETLHASYEGLETDAAIASAGNLLPLYQAVRAFSTEAARQTDENIRTVTLDETDFLLYYDKEGGTVTRLETKGADGSHVFDVLSCVINDDDAESSGTDTSK